MLIEKIPGFSARVRLFRSEKTFFIQFSLLTKSFFLFTITFYLLVFFTSYVFFRNFFYFVLPSFFFSLTQIGFTVEKIVFYLALFGFEPQPHPVLNRPVTTF
jgi:hypothetical protein